MIQNLARIIVAAGLFTAVIVPSARAQESAAPGPETAPAPQAVTVPVRMLGDPAAPVQIDEYASFVCEPCAQWHTTVLPGLIRDYVDAGHVKIVFHDVITHPAEHSARAAAIGLCAAPDRFFAVADSFMNGQGAVMNAPAAPWYAAAIAASGRTEEEMEECSVSETTYNQLALQQERAGALGLENFPVIRVNGQFVADPTDGAVRFAILSAPPAPELALPPIGDTAAEPAPQPASAD
ncbi:thioredoxin domain-containing protein [Brevundimonas sp.]|uniref:thioredoxin domain-containing protein n=1 Tax=Brevundimonas sp. TaxID=1871086 RepID=UPI001A337407|nr:thioredoxin domain-containing protein [Brevundimonas sp.]MBJ7485099.1 thioredoxin domain-containing protein [Brevundimonas sp.]